MTGRRDTVCENRLAGRLKEALWSRFHQCRVHWSYRSEVSYRDSRTQFCFNIHLGCSLSLRLFASTLRSRLSLPMRFAQTLSCALSGGASPSCMAILFQSWEVLAG